jgi:beta-lactam-binding protein with PASTA domain/predicted Ser/Thr protein kinase
VNGNMIGRVFNNRYQITERIGIGGMAEVYRAQDRVLGRLVAVKVMLPQYAADPEFTQRFRQEAASAANLQSPFIMNVYDWGQDEGTYYIVMEYVRGSDLKSAIKQRGPINQRKVAEIGAQVCQALSVAHNQDIIHRDIKPQNIMVQPDGNVKVMDFGIARAKNSVKSQTSAVLGTAHYISPEQAQGKDLTPASDIYSLGVVMYEAATGVLPFDGPDAVSVAMKQVSEFPVPPSQIDPEIDPALEAIIMHALEKDPLARFATVNDMKHALNDYLAGRSVNMDEAETQMMGGFPAAGGTSVMSPIEAAAPTHMGGQARKVKAVDEAAEKHKKRKRGIIIAVIIIAALAIIGGAVYALNNMPATGSIPDVSGKTVEQATATLQAAGYTVGTQTQVFSDSVASGSIVSTDPPAGTKADTGTKVNLSVSKGKDQIEVPDLSGMTSDQAKQALTKVGLTAKAGTSQHSDTVDKDKVMSQDPATGTKVDKGSTVTYVISLGADSATVPSVIGMSESDAKSALQNAGFNVSVQTDSTSSATKGTVFKQDPVDGNKAAKGSTVTIYVSAKPQTHTLTSSVSPTSSATIAFSKTTVNDGDSATYTITVAKGYSIVSVTDNFGSSYGTDTSGTINNITADTKIIVTLTQTTTTGGSTTGSTSGNSTSTGTS